MLSSTISSVGAGLSVLGVQLRAASESAAAELGRIDACRHDLSRSWQGPAVTAFAGRTQSAVDAVAPWPAALDSAATTVSTWAWAADLAAGHARSAEARLADAYGASLELRDVLVRAARSRVDEVRAEWVSVCRVRCDELHGAIATLAAVAEHRAFSAGEQARAVGITLVATWLEMDLDSLDPTGTLQRHVSTQLEQFVASPVAPLAFTIMETARDRDLFTADGNLSDDDLAAVDESWTTEAIGVWQRATGVELDDDVAASVAELIPLIATLMRADRDRDWTDEDGRLAGEPRFRDVLTDAAVASLTQSPSFVTDRAPGVDAIEAYVSAGAGDIDRLPDRPTASDLAYHFHGPPHIGEGFDNTAVFRTLLFDWEQVWGEDRSWFGGGVEVIGLIPFGKFTRVARIANWTDDALDVERALAGGLRVHEAAGGHVIRKHVGKELADLQARLDATGLRRVSTFANEAEAERVVAAAVVAAQPEIDAWRISQSRVIGLIVDLSSPAGRVLSSERGLEGGRFVRMVLMRDPTVVTGFRVHTAFVESSLS